MKSWRKIALIAVVCVFGGTAQLMARQVAPREGDYTAKNFVFESGEKLPELRLHYTTLGKPMRNAQGRVTNAVLILHGTGGSGRQFLQPIYAGVLFGPGSFWMPASTTLFCRTGSATENRRSRATACTHTFRITITTTWCAHSTCC